jgi:hypothetical protein
MAQNNMTARLMIHFVAKLTESFHRIRPPNTPATGSCRHLDDLLVDRQRDWFAMFVEAGKVAGDGVFDIVQGFAPGLPLRNTAGKRGTFRHEHPVLIRFYMDTKFHA